jgi:hypothetical protein
MTKLIAVAFILLVLFGGWHLFLYWEKLNDEQQAKQKQAAAAVVSEDQLPGLPEKLGPSLQAAKKQGAAALKKWLKDFGYLVQDPRKAWIELDYCVIVSHQDLTEARRVFAEVKARTSESSPLWPRIKQLEKTYQ